MENSIKSIAKNYGTYLGGLLALLTVLVYAVSLDMMTNVWYGIFILLLIVVFGIVSVAKTKGESEGYISFKQSFTAYFITILIGLVISTVVSYIIFNIIDPEAAEAIKEKTIEASIAMMEGFGAPPDSIARSEEHTSELQSRRNLVCRLLLEKKKKKKNKVIEAKKNTNINNEVKSV